MKMAICTHYVQMMTIRHNSRQMTKEMPILYCRMSKKEKKKVITMAKVFIGNVKGPQGEKGDTGARGPQGIQGEKGDTGPQGPQGIQGPAGESGASYEAGTFTGILSNSSNSNIASAKGIYKKIESLVYIYVAIQNMTGKVPNKLKGLPFATAGALSMSNKSELFIYDATKEKIARPTQISKTDGVILDADDVSGMGGVELWGWYHV
nr:MAG TPA: collagen alpha 1(VIII) chain protein [Caudoviricetes sp.]